MRRIGVFALKFVIAIVAAILLAGGSVWYALRPTNYGGEIRNGEWTTDLTTGGKTAGLYQRAQVALYGLWAMSSSETIYFIANTDAAGAPLAPNCTYSVSGAGDPDARWWSLTVYKNFHFVPNEGKVYSYSQTSVEREPDDSWRVMVSPEKQPRNWLPTGDGAAGAAGDLKLVFRAYNPSQSFVNQIGSVKLPSVKRESCR
ncbi:MAG: hypothetical protein AVDCRST_MAG74-342 [uncultured Pyrinomonadaceae bacterium]|uniref:DUF1214 domain-containing protein n=1 Tax=uncultured Pyrinomonadaceae bacterium TaxID=2283094 RepID=A0A6J4NBM2_9BACT|nr:MAG: hypothetical protein AVDCRST_MAG74-342 [uncultured Pyrinomonadaceae bacterium]